MAITFLEKRKKQRYLILAFAIIILTGLSIVWYGFFIREGPVPAAEIITPSKIEINWETLKNSRLEQLQVFEEIVPLEEKAGRENPFTPY